MTYEKKLMTDADGEWNVNSFFVHIVIISGGGKRNLLVCIAELLFLYAHLSLVDSLFIALSLFHTHRLWVMMLISNYCDRSYDYVCVYMHCYCAEKGIYTRRANEWMVMMMIKSFVRVCLAIEGKFKNFKSECKIKLLSTVVAIEK